MGYWINIHHPQALDESRRDQLRVCVQEKSRSDMTKIPEGDLVFIYETEALSGKNVYKEDANGKRIVQLGQGGKSVIALVRIVRFRKGKWKWNGIPFVGSYDTREVECRRGFVPLDEIDKARLKAGLSKFNPRIPGGLRDLSKEEFNIMADLIGFEETDDSRGWSGQEVWDTIYSYMSMLKCELNQQEYSKADSRKELLAKLSKRTQGAVEYKYQNISAILAELGYPYIVGYQPHFGHYQKRLRDAVIRYISEDDKLSSTIVKAIRRTPAKPYEVTAISEIIVDPPPSRLNRSTRQSSNRRRTASGIDYTAKEAANRRLGHYGEQFVLALEKVRLTNRNRADLAQKVEWITKTKGDGLGYDVLSYDEAGNKLFIEVKTTNQGKYFPFLVSANEVAIPKKLSDSYRIYRVFSFSSQPKLYILSGPITRTCNLQPITFKARL
jgi:hypothetical protein